MTMLVSQSISLYFIERWQTFSVLNTNFIYDSTETVMTKPNAEACCTHQRGCGLHHGLHDLMAMCPALWHNAVSGAGGWCDSVTPRSRAAGSSPLSQSQLCVSILSVICQWQWQLSSYNDNILQSLCISVVRVSSVIDHVNCELFWLSRVRPNYVMRLVLRC